MPIPPAFADPWPMSALHSRRPLAASMAKKLSPFPTLLPTNTRPLAIAGVPDGGNRPSPTSACHSGVKVSTLDTASRVPPGLWFERLASPPYIGQSAGALGTGDGEGTATATSAWPQLHVASAAASSSTRQASGRRLDRTGMT